MKTIDILGNNRYQEWTKKRVACRGILLKGGLILLTYEVNTDQWFISGGGVEWNEELQECCVREIAEETGFLVCADTHFLTIHEFYEEWFFISHYFVCECIGNTERKLTQRELEVGLKPRWIKLEDAIDIFSKHQEYATTDEMKRGTYLREYIALKELLKWV